MFQFIVYLLFISRREYKEIGVQVNKFSVSCYHILQSGALSKLSSLVYYRLCIIHNLYPWIEESPSVIV